MCLLNFILLPIKYIHSAAGCFWLSACLHKFLHKKKTAFRSAVFLGEGIFTMGYSKNYIMYWGIFTVIIIAWTPAKVCTNLTKSMTRFWLFCISENKIKKTASNAVFLGEGIFTMGYSKNYIMYWGGFYSYYNTMDGRISVHKVEKSSCVFLVSSTVLYSQF